MKSIATYALTFLGYIISVLASVFSLLGICYSDIAFGICFCFLCHRIVCLFYLLLSCIFVHLLGFLENDNDKQLIFPIYSFVSINDLSPLTHYIRARAGATLGLGVRDKHQHQILSTTYHSLHTWI